VRSLALVPGAALIASLALAACGGGSGSAASSSAPHPSTTVGVKSIDGVGDVLVDSTGKALYAADIEAGGKVMCDAACTSFWHPLTPGSGAPTAASNAGKVALVKRPDGTRQVTVDGKLLYTFADDSAGQLKGIGFQDDFGGHHFTWSAVLAGGKLATRSGAQSGGYGGGSGY
jgi:predicted lipoprotein with Yx(FWY)xxD motif